MSETIPLCKCGCGKPVMMGKYSKKYNLYLNGHNTGTKETKDKKIKTSLKKRGVNHSHQDPKVKEKVRLSCLKKFGSDYVFQSEDVKDKIKETNVKRYGVKNPTQNLEIRNKQIETLKSRYDVSVPYRSEYIRDKGKHTCLKNHGVDNYAKTLEFRELARGWMIDAISDGLKDGEKFTPRKGNNELPFILELQKQCEYFIDNNSIIRKFFPDGYIEELNLVIEFDEPWHKHKWAMQHDDIKDKTYLDEGLIIFRVDEKEWLNDKDSVLIEFKELIWTLKN